MSASDKSKIEEAVRENLTWLDSNQEATKEEFAERQKEVESIVNPIMMKAYTENGGGEGNSMPMPGGMPSGGGGYNGPTVEEVD